MPLCVLVTGAAGRLGSEVARVLVEAGMTVRATDAVYRRDLAARLEVADLLDAPAAYRLLEGCQAVVHLANHPGPHTRRPPQTLYAENVTMDMNVFQAAADAGVRRVVFASSVQVIAGDRAGDRGEKDLARPSCLAYLPIDGQMPACPRNTYALSKEAGEQMLRYFAALDPDLSATAIRYPFLAERWHLEWFRRRGRDRPTGFLDEGFTYLATADAAALVRAILERQGPGYHQVLPAAPDPYLARPIAEIVREYYPAVPLRAPLERMTSLVDLSGIERAVGWTPKEVNFFSRTADGAGSA